MITVDQALDKLLELVSPLDAEMVPLAKAAGRVLAQTVKATRNQPPFASSGMDGYAVQAANAHPGASFAVIGESAAGHRFDGSVGPDQAVRIFTGAPVPTGASRVIIQEDVQRNGDQITLNENLNMASYVRAAGGDFIEGSELAAPRVLSASDVALLAAMNIASVPVCRKPVVALIATGDELVMPGEFPRDDQIIASNCFGLAAMIDDAGGSARILPIARDTIASLKTAFDLASDADLIVTIGGASVGDHDLVGQVAAELGMDQAFYKVAMRPGKPLMAGRIGSAAMIGLPGNPVSSMVCGKVFLQPALRAMLGLDRTAVARQTATLANDLPSNGTREHYMRAHVENGQITAFGKQDSSLLTVLSMANALLVRPVGDPPKSIGDFVEYIPL